MFKRLFNRDKAVEITIDPYTEETKRGVLLGFVPGEYPDPNAYPSQVMVKATMAVVNLDGEIKEFPIRHVKII